MGSGGGEGRWLGAAPWGIVAPMKWLVLGAMAALMAWGCGSSDDGDDGSQILESATGGATGTGGSPNLLLGQNPPGSTVTPGTDDCLSCAIDEGCFVASITRAADVSQLPWTLWPGEADGAGTLYFSVERAGYVWWGQAPADLVADPGPHELGNCISEGDGTLLAFLDDDGDASDAPVTNGDYVDACGSPRAATIKVPVGSTLTVPFELAASCD